MARPISHRCQKCGRAKGPGECVFCRTQRQAVYRQSDGGIASTRRSTANYTQKARDFYKVCVAAGIKDVQELHQLLMTKLG